MLQFGRWTEADGIFNALLGYVGKISKRFQPNVPDRIGQRDGGRKACGVLKKKLRKMEEQ
jgi:hypothetical protein